MKELSLSFGHFKREDELPLTITVNGCTYQSQHLVDATKKTYFEMGKAEGTLERVDQFNKGYEIGKYEGYEAGKKSNGYTSDDIKQLHTDNEYTRKIWYDKGKAEGYDAGYNDGYEQRKHDGISNKEIPGEYLSHIEEAYDDGYKEGYTDCREVAKMLNKYGIDDEDGVAE
jgi:flagellar biosynthesis/type III secretory pathway protein FliH